MFIRILAYIEFLVIYFLGKIFTISYVVRYLRNPNPRITTKLLRAFNAQIGDNTTIKRSLIVDNVYEDENSTGNLSYLSIGKNCYIGDSLFIDLSNKIIIENNVVISAKVSLITHADCNRSEYLAEKFPRQCQPIYIKKGAWIGFNATILSGVTVEENSVVGANSLLNRNSESKTVFAGLPAKRIKKLENFTEESDL